MFVVKVNNYEITIKEYQEEINRILAKNHLSEPNQKCRQQAIDQLVNGCLLLNEARNSDVTVNEEEIENKMVEFMLNYETEEDFLLILHKQGITVEQARDRIRDQLLVKKFIHEKFAEDCEVPEEKLREVYQENKELFIIKEKIRAYHILFRGISAESLKRAETTRKTLTNSGDFVKFVKEHDPSDLDCEAADLGYFERGKMVEEFENAAFRMSVNQISLPVKTAFGYHLILITDKTDETFASFEKIKNLLIRRINKIEAELKLIRHIQKLKAQADIQLNQEFLK